MKPHIEGSNFGSITINGETYDHDVVIRLNGEIKKRKKKLSKVVYGTSHKVSIQEAEYIFQEDADRIIIGTGQYGALNLSDEATKFFNEIGCKVDLIPTPDAINKWNKTEGKLVGMFHITC